MATNDERLREDLRAAYGADLPDEAFAARVLDRIEGPGGRTKELSVPDPAARRPLLWLGIGVAAAALLLAALFGLEVVGGPGEASENVTPAAPAPEVELPPSKSAVEPAEAAVVVIHVDAEGQILLDGKVIEITVLKKALEARAAKHPTGAPGRPSGLRVRIRADRRVSWRQIQWIMQACADPDVRIFKLSFAATRDEKEGEIPVPLPVDRGLELLRPATPPAPHLKVRLVRGERDQATRIEFNGRAVGQGEKAWLDLAARIDQFRPKRPASPMLDAVATIPHEEVVRALDLLLEAGYKQILFVGTPPPKGSEKKKETSRRLHAVLRREGGRTILEYPAGKAAETIEKGLEALLGRWRTLRDAGLDRPVSLEVRPGVPEADRRRAQEALREARVEVMFEED